MCKEIHKEIQIFFVCSFPYKENGWRFILSSSKNDQSKCGPRDSEQWKQWTLLTDCVSSVINIINPSLNICIFFHFKKSQCILFYYFVLNYRKQVTTFLYVFVVVFVHHYDLCFWETTKCEKGPFLKVLVHCLSSLLQVFLYCLSCFFLFKYPVFVIKIGLVVKMKRRNP